MALRRPVSQNVINQLNTPPETTPLQKVVIIFAMGVFVTLACLTAGLPINYLSHQPTTFPTDGDDDANGPLPGPHSTLDKGDTAWMIVATAFAIMSAPVLAYVHGNLFGRHSSFSVQVSLLVASMIAVLWIIFSFSLTYAKDANGTQILGLPKYYYMFAHVWAAPDGTYTHTVPFSIFAIFELAYPILSASIVVTAILDRVNVYGLMFFMFVWHLCIYTPIAHITWNDRGFFHTNYIEDYAGGLVVMMTAGITAITAHVFLNWIQAPVAEPRKPTDPLGALMGTWALWFLWFGVNAGKAYSSGPVTTQTIVNTIAGVTTSLLVNFYWDWFEGIKASPVTLTNAMLLGIVATTPSSGFVSVGGSQVIAVFTVLVTRLFGKYWWKETLDETTFSVGNLYGIGGSTAFLFTALLSYEFINPTEALNGLTFGIATPIRHHTAAILAMWICLFCANLVALFLCNIIVPMSRAKQDAENSPKGEYAPAPLGPFAGNDQSGYAQKSNYNIDSNAEPQPQPDQQA